MSTPSSAPAAAGSFRCPSCGAGLGFAPGTTSLQCPYCRAKVDLGGVQLSNQGGSAAVATAPAPAPTGSKHPYTWQPPAVRAAQVPPAQVSCQQCGATSETTFISGPCPYCKTPQVYDPSFGGQLLTPDLVLPFALDKAAAQASFKEWVGSRWFAPNALKKVATTESMHGEYLPHWSFDDDTFSSYTGQRGEYYYVTESYTDAQGNRQTRQVRKIRWYSASGQVARQFYDVIAAGTTTLDADKLAKLGPWQVEQAHVAQPQLIAGFTSPRYDLDNDHGFEDARAQMARVIEQDCRADIGGDEQRVHHVETTDRNVMFALMLLPLWIATYIFAGQSYQVLVNANTGQVIGDRPYSKVKIALAVIAGLILAGVALYFYQTSQSNT